MKTMTSFHREDWHSRAPSCWTAQSLDSFQELWRCDSFVAAMKQSTPVSPQDFTDNFRHRLRGACQWRAVEGVDPRTISNKSGHISLLIKMCASLSGCQDICIWICISMSCRMLVY
eukprot:236495-Pelagomonas_calceolata.AAC.1